MSSSDLAIAVRGLGKAYTIHHHAPKHTTLTDALVDRVRHPFKKALGETFWALRDINFDIRQGEVVGIIGRNGAGKSTLLKILSRITRPTNGSVYMYGRAASLLEVGTGFHPELTGRENIYLNGAILGMSRAEIRTKFDEIVAFADVEKFLDTPVKRYSSGMYVRLAFAVAAHLEPEILIVDEVLAVGDLEFQKKCMGKMQAVGQDGRTVLFVSHSMSAITRLCPRAILLDTGRVASDGPVSKVTSVYMSSGMGLIGVREWPELKIAPGNDIVRLRKIRVCTSSGQTMDSMDIRRPIGIEVTFDVLQEGNILVPNLVFTNEEGICVFHPHDWGADWRGKPRPKGRHLRTAWVSGNMLPEGTFVVGVALSSYNPLNVHCYERDAVAFEVFDSLSGDSARGDYGGILPGVTRPILDWTDGPTQAETA